MSDQQEEAAATTGEGTVVDPAQQGQATMEDGETKLEEAEGSQARGEESSRTSIDVGGDELLTPPRVVDDGLEIAESEGGVAAREEPSEEIIAATAEDRSEGVIANGSLVDGETVQEPLDTSQSEEVERQAEVKSDDRVDQTAAPLASSERFPTAGIDSGTPGTEAADIIHSATIEPDTAHKQEDLETSVEGQLPAAEPVPIEDAGQSAESNTAASDAVQTTPALDQEPVPLPVAESDEEPEEGEKEAIGQIDGIAPDMTKEGQEGIVEDRVEVVEMEEEQGEANQTGAPLEASAAEDVAVKEVARSIEKDAAITMMSADLQESATVAAAAEADAAPAFIEATAAEGPIEPTGTTDAQISADSMATEISTSQLPKADEAIVIAPETALTKEEGSIEQASEEAPTTVPLTPTITPPVSKSPTVKQIGQENSFADGKKSPSVFASPATPKSALSAAVPSSASPSSNDPLVRQIALVLKINKELIRLCVDLQAKDLASDALFKDAALRLQSNLAFLASIADRSTKSSSNGSANNDPAATLLHNEPFPPTLHAPDSQLPKLYQLLSSFSSNPIPTSEQTKRQRSASQDSQRKRSKDQTSIIDTSQQPPKTQQQQQHQAPQQMYTTPSQPVTETNGAAGMMPNISNPSQVHSLTQAFGPNAVMNLNALQAHYRGQPQAVVSYMEANVPGFRNLPIQVQLQQMTGVQNAAMQRQRQQSQSVGSQQSTPPQQQQQQSSRRTSSVADPTGARLTSSQQQGRPGTPQNAFGQQMSSPAAISAASPASHLMPSPTSYSPQQQQQNQTQGSAASYASVPGAAMMSNMPTQIQQQLLQQFQQQQLHNQQFSNNPQHAFAPAPPSQHQPNGLTWPPIQQPPS